MSHRDCMIPGHSMTNSLVVCISWKLMAPPWDFLRAIAKPWLHSCWVPFKLLLSCGDPKVYFITLSSLVVSLALQPYRTRYYALTSILPLRWDGRSAAYYICHRRGQSAQHPRWSNGLLGWLWEKYRHIEAKKRALAHGITRFSGCL